MFVNGSWVGVHRDCDALLTTLRLLKRQGAISFEVSIVRDIKAREVRVFTDCGRIMRPLYIVGEDQKLTIKKKHMAYLEDDNGWRKLLENGLIEMIDAEEEEVSNFFLYSHLPFLFHHCFYSDRRSLFRFSILNLLAIPLLLLTHNIAFALRLPWWPCIPPSSLFPRLKCTVQPILTARSIRP